MKVIIRLSELEELKALPILLRHSPGMVLPGRVYVIDAAALSALREASVQCQVVAADGCQPSAAGVRI